MIEQDRTLRQSEKQHIAQYRTNVGSIEEKGSPVDNAEINTSIGQIKRDAAAKIASTKNDKPRIKWKRATTQLTSQNIV